MKFIAVNEVQNEILIHGDECVTTMEEVYKALADPNCTELHLTKEFVDKHFTYTALCDFVENSATVAVNATITVEGTSYVDMNSAVRSLFRYKSLVEFEYALVENSSKVIATVQELCKYYFETREEALVANNKLSTVMMQLEERNNDLKQMKEEYSKLQELNNETTAKLQALVNRVNYRYEKTVNPDRMFTVSDNQFKRILYIKEITRVHYTDTLLHYLQETLKTLYSVPSRTVIIEPYYSYGREKLYLGYKPHWQLTYQDVYSGDIFMAGFQPKLMEKILLNSNHVHYLIVVDRGGYMINHVTGRNVATVYTASTISDIKENVPKDRIISYEESTLNIPYIDGFNELSAEDKIHKYSSMPIMKALIDILEEEI